MFKFSLQKIDARLRLAHEQRKADLIELVRRSGVMSVEQIDDHLAVIDYREMIIELGKVLTLSPQIVKANLVIVGVILHIKSWLGTAVNAIWKHGGVHIVLNSFALIEVVIGFSSVVQNVRCSRKWMWFTGTVSQACQDIFTGVSNRLFSLIVCLLTKSMTVQLFTLFQQMVWPYIRTLTSTVTLLVSVLWLIVLSPFVGKPTLLTYVKVLLKLSRHYRLLPTDVDTNTILIDAMLGRYNKESDQNLGSSHTELWVDVFPAGELFDTKETSKLMTLWRQIDELNSLDEQLFGLIKESFSDYSPAEIVEAIRHIARPPRPVLSAILVATGHRMGVAAELALHDFPNLASETSRWRFFSQMNPPLLPCCALPKVTFLISIAEYHRPRIWAAKHYARIIELVLIDEQNNYEFAFAFPACRPHSPAADSRTLFVSEFHQSLAGRHLPPNVTITLLSNLSTDITLPNIKGLQYILALQKLCGERDSQDVIVLSELNDSASWLNIFQLYHKLPRHEHIPCLVSGCRPFSGAGKPLDGHAATRLFNALFRSLIPIINVRDSSAVIKLATVGSLRSVSTGLSCLDYAIDQDILAMMSLKGNVYEVPIQWFQALGPHGHERSYGSIWNQVKSLQGIARKIVRERKLVSLHDTEFLPVDAGFDFQAYLSSERRIVKGFIPGQNRLLLLISAIRSLSRGDEVDEGHQRFSTLVPLVTSMIRLIGQGPLKAILRILEGRYRDPLPQIEEQLKRDVPQIVETCLSYYPTVKTIYGNTQYLFTLTQPFASLGVLESALEWNLRYGLAEGVSDTLACIVRLQSELFRHGAFDPDMKSLFDCGLFLEADKMTLKYLDFAGFTCDPYVVKLLLPMTMNRIVSMKDFRYIARRLAGSAKHRAILFSFKRMLAELYDEMCQRSDWSQIVSFRVEIPLEDSHLQELPDEKALRKTLITQVIAKAKFRSHALISDLDHQCILRGLVDRGYAKLLPGRPRHHMPVATEAPSCDKLHTSLYSRIEVTFLVENKEVGNAVKNALMMHMPEIRSIIRVIENPRAIPLFSILREVQNANSMTKVLVPMAGGSSRMERLLIGSKLPHKGLLRLFGRPLVVHALATQAIPLARTYPGLSWVINPDTIIFWDRVSVGNTNLTADVIVPFPPVMTNLVQVAEYWTQNRYKNLETSDETAGIGDLLARCFLADHTGGYSLPSLLGVRPDLLREAYGDLRIGDQGIRDFWKYSAASLNITSLCNAGKVASLLPLMWYDIDTPSLLKTFYDGCLNPIGDDCWTSLLGLREAPALDESIIQLENTACVESSLSVSPNVAGKILLRRCFFDHSEVNFDIDPRLPQVVLDGLVVANSQIAIKIVAPIVRDVLVHGVENGLGHELILELDNQVFASGANGSPHASPLMLSDLALNGYSELLRCTVSSPPLPRF